MLKHVIVMAMSVLLCASASARGLQRFQTPTGNIHCIASDNEDDQSRMLDCEIIVLNPDRPLRPRPKDCDLEWGHRFSLSESGLPTMECTGDTLRSQRNHILKVGDTVDAGNGLTCKVNRAGLSCQNSEAHGFFLARGKQQIY